ncbi:MAG: ATP-binding protein [Paludibacter sp.]|nr:ATP-binding protein [Paludibacter sp.]
MNESPDIPATNESIDARSIRQQNEQYARLQELMIKMSSTYINIELEKVDEVIQQSLQEMAEFVDADRAYIFDYDFEKNICINTFEWCREGISAEIDNLRNVPLDFVPNWVGIHRKGETFYMPDINLLPLNGPYSVRGLLEPQGVKSLITLPMILKNDVVGFVGFDSVRNYHAYSERERDLLLVFSQMLVNITERKHQAEALIHAKNVAEEALKTKEIFLATMSHEIRTPLNVITGMVREILKQDLTAEQRSLMSNAKSAAVHLLSILNNILDLTKIEANEFVLDKGVFDLKKVVRDAESIMSLQAREKNLNLKLEMEPSMHTVFYGDEARIRQVLINLMDNAIKFTETGTIGVKLWQSDSKGGMSDVHVQVSDTGIGIRPEFMDKLFSKFTQEDNDSRRSYQGTGLGMSIVKNIVQLMGGSIDVKSTKGEGTVFHFNLLLQPAPFEMLQPVELQSDEVEEYAGKRILVVEDNEMNRYVVLLTLQSLMCEVVEVENGEQAVEILKSEPFDLIFMDIQMPRMDGVEATQLIRKELAINTPIIALTANAFQHNIDHYLAAGMNDFIVKPYLEKDFKKILRKYLPSGITTADVQLFDSSLLREVCKNDTQFMHRMMALFIKVVDEALPELQRMRGEQDFEGISRLVHKLKPSIEHMAITSVKESVQFLEKANNEPSKEAELYRQLDKLVSVLQQVREQVSKENI